MNLELEKDDHEQYVCFRIEDILLKSEETADNIYEKVGDLLKIKYPYVPVSCFDRAHRVGPEYKPYKDKKKCCGMIVRFVSYRHRTLFYRKRKNLKDVRIKLDLSKQKMLLI